MSATGIISGSFIISSCQREDNFVREKNLTHSISAVLIWPCSHTSWLFAIPPADRAKLHAQKGDVHRCLSWWGFLSYPPWQRPDTSQHCSGWTSCEKHVPWNSQRSHENARGLQEHFCCLSALCPSCSPAPPRLKQGRWHEASHMGTEAGLLRALLRSGQAGSYFKRADCQACGSLHRLCAGDFRKRTPSSNKFWARLCLWPLADITCKHQWYKNRART